MDMQGVSADIKQWDVASSGTVTMDLATISPVTGSMQSFGTQAFTVQGLELVQEINSDIQTRTEPNTGCTGRTTRP